MQDFAMAYWWLIFPIMWFVSSLFGMWMHHRRQQDTLELMKTYAAQGKDPSELAKTLGPDPSSWDYRWSRRAWRYGPGWGWRGSPFWAWRRAIMTGCVAIGFWIAAYYADWSWGGPGFTVVAVIMSVIAAGSLLTAIFASLFDRGPAKS
jgi:hypothetical protein